MARLDEAQKAPLAVLLNGLLLAARGAHPERRSRRFPLPGPGDPVPFLGPISIIEFLPIHLEVDDATLRAGGDGERELPARPRGAARKQHGRDSFALRRKLS